jgi:hypothetical protein
MRLTLLSLILITCAAGPVRAEVISTEPSCTYPVEHKPDSDVAAADPFAPPPLPPLELQIRRYIPVHGGWFLEAALGTIRLDPATGAVNASPGLLTATSTEPSCD